MLNLSSLVGFLVLGFIGWVTYKLFIWPFYISPLRKIPGPPSESIIFGNFKSILSKEEPFLEWIQKYGNIVKYNGTFNRPNIVIADTKIIQDITLNHVYDFIKPPEMWNDFVLIIGRGLVLAENEDHKRQRKMMNPAFAHNNIKEMVPTFIRHHTYIIPFIYLGFNYEFNSLTSSNELADAYAALFSNNTNSAARFFISILSRYIPIVRNIPIDINRKFKNACAVIDRVSKKLMKEKNNEAKNGELKSKDLLSLLININKTLPIEEKLTDEELQYQIMTFLIAGHETTSSTTMWALYLLAKYPHEQDLLREELVKAFPDKSKFNPSFDEINSLEYLNCIVKETLRTHPPVPMISRANVKDKVIGGYLIPKNTIIMVAISVLHKSTEIWGPTANDFDPKRWLNPLYTKNVTNYNYLPFITGARSCIGNKLALAEFKILLSTLIRNFVFQPIEGFNFKEKSLLNSKPSPYLGLVVSKVEG
ncbi:cytochrome P450 [Rhizophagus irregularis]|uniref:Cytochrome P450 n=1 Tax=Rhizophagus irregularis TaxID=588596 RepID=A0A2N0PRV8_9GLOM|nr:cytochrome P450 [Rhizophagus irregularis]